MKARSAHLAPAVVLQVTEVGDAVLRVAQVDARRVPRRAERFAVRGREAGCSGNAAAPGVEVTPLRDGERVVRAGRDAREARGRRRPGRGAPPRLVRPRGELAVAAAPPSVELAARRERERVPVARRDANDAAVEEQSRGPKPRRPPVAVGARAGVAARVASALPDHAVAVQQRRMIAARGD